MPVAYTRPPAWLWGACFGLFIGGGVVFVSTVIYGFNSALLLVGGVLALVFTIIGLFSGFVRRYIPGRPV